MKDFIKEEKLEKLFKMMKVTIENVDTVLKQKADVEISAVNNIKETKIEAETLIEDIAMKEKELNNDISKLNSILSASIKDNSEDLNKAMDDPIEHELSCLEKHIRDRFNKIKTELTSKMNDQIKKLENVWKSEAGTIDLIGLKEVKFEFDQIDKSLKHMINECCLLYTSPSPRDS